MPACMPFYPAKSILSAYRQNGWFGSGYTMNLYRGCSHGCIYCDSRSDCYQVDNFDQVRGKVDALTILEGELRAKRRRGVVISGSMSDCYNPFEADYMQMRGALELLARYGYGVAVDTKSDTVARDSDLFVRIAQKDPVSVNFTITTFEDSLCGKIEPRVCPSSCRFRALKALSDAGIPCGVLLMPILPFVNDTAENILSIVHESVRCGAKWIFAGHDFGLTLRQNQRVHYLQQLARFDSAAARKTAQAYPPQQYFCPSPHSKELMAAFAAACEEHGLLWRMEDISRRLWEPYRKEQLSLF